MVAATARPAGAAAGAGDLAAGWASRPGQILPPPSGEAEQLFGAHLSRLAAFGELLATDGVRRGLIGPREIPLLWDRHLVNCALLAELLDPGIAVVDVGSGAGLPGIVLAMIRADLRVTLVEPMARRTVFLEECRAALGLANVVVVRGRAEERSTIAVAGGADVVTSRAVAPLDRLAAWCLPLVRVGGRMLAMKGERASVELDRTRRDIERLGGTGARVVRCGIGVVETPATVVEIVRRELGHVRRDRGRERR